MITEGQFETERAAVTTLFETAWGSKSAVKWPNYEFNEAAQVEPWVAFTLLTGEGLQISLGDRALHRYGGLVIIQVFQKELTGTKEQRLFAGKVSEIFIRKELVLPDEAVITFRTPFAKDVGLINGWNQINVNCPYIRSAFHERS